MATNTTTTDTRTDDTTTTPRVTGPHTGVAPGTRTATDHHTYWRCEGCGLESTDRAVFECDQAHRDGCSYPDA